MADSPEIIQQLRDRLRLPEAQLTHVAAALRGAPDDLEGALRGAGVDASLITAFLTDQSPSPGRAPGRERHGVSSGRRSAGGSDPRSDSGGRPVRRTGATPVQTEPSVDELVSRLMDITPRFELQGEIARGAMGRILSAWDLHLGRAVAIKVLRKSAARDLDRVRFLEEAQVTGQLAHPSVMPIYELGRLRGQIAFVMKKVEGQSLKTVISELRKGDPAITEQFGRMRILHLFHQLCMAVAFAHSRGVVHRDLKPSNVMVGDFGEVVLLDWGLCKIIAQGTRSTRSTSERWRTVHGQIIGTPAYMAPEQAMGLIDQVDERTDVYGLGAILYHLITLKPPFSGQTNREIVQRVLRETVKPCRERAPNQEIDPELEEICMRCLARDADDRFPNARALADRVTAYLEAPKAAPTRTDVSTHMVAGTSALARQQGLLEDLALALDTVETERARVSTADPPERKRSLWAAEERLRELHARFSEATATAFIALARALAVNPENAEARTLICELFINQYNTALARQDEPRAAYFRRLLREHDDGRYAALVEEVGSVHLDVSPRGSRVEIVQLRRVGRRMVAGQIHARSTAPVAVDRLPAGHYLVRLEAPGCDPLVTPLLVSPGRSTRMRLRMLPAGTVPRGFAHVPAGTFRYGSPRSDYAPPGEHALADLFMAVDPVTAGEYLEYLDGLRRRDPDQARARAPRGPDGAASPWLGGDGRIRLPSGGWRPEMPVTGVSQEDARAYCHWRSLREGTAVRLPYEEEWEKAARGTDGRTYSWGWDWEPGYAAGPEVWRGALPPRVGWAEADRSPYGVRDLVGGVREWTATVEPGAEGHIVVRGGSFLTGGVEGRPLWRREVVWSDRTAPDLGFRVVREITGG